MFDENKKPKTERRSEIMNFICIAYFWKKNLNDIDRLVISFVPE